MNSTVNDLFSGELVIDPEKKDPTISLSANHHPSRRWDVGLVHPPYTNTDAVDSGIEPRERPLGGRALPEVIEFAHSCTPTGPIRSHQGEFRVGHTG